MTNFSTRIIFENALASLIFMLCFELIPSHRISEPISASSCSLFSLQYPKNKNLPFGTCERLNGGGRRGEKRIKIKRCKKPDPDDENGDEPHDSSEGMTDLKGKPERHKRYFRRNRWSTGVNRDLHDLMEDWQASWNDKTGYDLHAPGRDPKPTNDAAAAQWFESRKSLKKQTWSAKQALKGGANASATTVADAARIKADAKRVQQLLGIR
jgi:hypothetical protein